MRAFSPTTTFDGFDLVGLVDWLAKFLLKQGSGKSSAFAAAE